MYVVKNIFTNNFKVNVSKEIYRNFPRKPHLSINPGIQQRKALLEDTETIDLSDYDYDLEADFSNIGTSHKEYMHEIRKEKEKICKQIAKQKYFKEKTPNFLTWSDKEQIRYLHNTNPETWTIQKLSESFPALPHIMSRIVKPRTWEKNSEKKIQSHDKSVQRNWELFKQNKLTTISTDLNEHLKKFTNRNLDLNYNYVSNSKRIQPKSKDITIGSEFSDIITSYQTLKKKTEGTDEEYMFTRSTKNQDIIDDKYVLTSKFKKREKHVTLQELQNDIAQKSLSGTVMPDEELLLKETKREIDCMEETGVIAKPQVEIHNERTTKALMKKKKTVNDYLLQYPEKIIIPKEIKKTGCTYKLNDCYYDDDGLFLYRVPGMYK